MSRTIVEEKKKKKCERKSESGKANGKKNISRTEFRTKRISYFLLVKSHLGIAYIEIIHESFIKSHT